MPRKASTLSIPQAQAGPQGKRARRLNKPPLIYLASPIPTYTTARYDAMLEHARRAYPDSELLPARGLYLGSDHWRQTWPQHLKRITSACFFPDVDGSIGLGVHRELQDVIAACLPVHLLQDNGELVPFERVRLILIDGGASWRKYAHVSVRPARKKANSEAS